MLASVVGGVILSIAVITVGIERIAAVGIGEGLLAGPVVGMGLGLSQWLALRRRTARAGWWIVASVIGWLAGFVALAADHLPAALLLPGLITGLAMEELEAVTERHRSTANVGGVDRKGVT
jgi:hypothetical protein